LIVKLAPLFATIEETHGRKDALFAVLETAPVVALPLHFLEIFRQNSDQLVMGFQGRVDASTEPSIG
jgi:hypothetical protein